MENTLLKILIEKKFITTVTEFDAEYRGVDIAGNSIVRSAGTFTVAGATFYKSGAVTLVGVNVVDGVRRVVAAEDIIRVDGMEPIRFAETCGLDPDGEKIPQGVRRGRKRKVRDA